MLPEPDSIAMDDASQVRNRKSRRYPAEIEQTDRPVLKQLVIKANIESRDALIDTELCEIARMLARLDLHLISILTYLVDRLGRENLLREYRGNLLPQRQDYIMHVQADLNDICELRAAFHRGYLEEGEFAKIWRDLLGLYLRMRAAVCDRNAADEAYLDHHPDAYEIYPSDSQRSEFPRWENKTIQLFTSIGQMARTFLDRRSHQAAGLFKSIEERQELAKSVIETSERQEWNDNWMNNPAEDSSSDTETNSRLGTVLWLLFFVTIVGSSLAFAVGYRCSSHDLGHLDEADFWFLLQTSLLQILGLIFSFISARKSTRISRGIWIMWFTIGLICTLSALPLYLYAPSEWSNLSSSLGALAQIFWIMETVSSSPTRHVRRSVKDR